MTPRIITFIHKLNQQTDTRLQFFVIMDDIIDVNYNKIVKQLFSTYRNAGISTLHSVQYMNYMNPNARAQCHCIFLGKQNNNNEIFKTCQTYLYGIPEIMKLIPPEHTSKTKKLNWIVEWYKYHTQDYNFIVYDVLNTELYRIKSKKVIS